MKTLRMSLQRYCKKIKDSGCEKPFRLFLKHADNGFCPSCQIRLGKKK